MADAGDWKEREKADSSSLSRIIYSACQIAVQIGRSTNVEAQKSRQFKAFGKDSRAAVGWNAPTPIVQPQRQVASAEAEPVAATAAASTKRCPRRTPLVPLVFALRPARHQFVDHAQL